MEVIMKRWMNVLAVLFVLGGGLALSACEPPEDMQQEEMDNQDG